ncbi:hypothetical protein [Pelotomaculum propionicicum]|mgnify:CR=1 FL=1|uniref:Uncharacterized protein n=1 Tax=Pelotomaculum propionicicum TaxID=258475 RepID=A0A4Y7RPF7_9FIRM|nr:hypothetical protein [Pelotomaculum propionicicum]NLI13823.1 hypothetical protein [Peptococcaceae bacterium]TEB10865.1 hypothetical protein Pmgp_02032 [Pelotomaculum propionicicum]
MQKPGTQEHKKVVDNIILMPLQKSLQRRIKKAHSGTTWRERFGPDAQEAVRGFAQYLTEDGSC